MEHDKDTVKLARVRELHKVAQSLLQTVYNLNEIVFVASKTMASAGYCMADAQKNIMKARKARCGVRT